MNRSDQIKALEKDWKVNPRWDNVKRPYSAEDVVRLRGSVQPECTYARRGAEKLWDLVNGSSKKGYVNCMGAITAGQAMQQAKAGIEAIYLSGWQVAAWTISSICLSVKLADHSWNSSRICAVFFQKLSLVLQGY